MDPEKKQNEVTVDDILHDLGPFKKFNIYNYGLILVPVFLAGMYSSVFNFEVLDLDYRCAVPECADNPDALNYTIPRLEDGNFAKCLRYDKFSNSSSNGSCSADVFDTSNEIECTEFVYLEKHSIVKEFNLACQDWKRTLVGSVHNAGFFVSIPLTGLISDKFGRKLAVVFASVANGVFGLIRALSVNYDMFVVFEFLEPAFGGGVYTACFVLALELVGPKGRVFVSLLFNTMFILGGVTVTLLSLWLQNWRYLLFIIYTPAVFIFLYMWMLTESFRYILIVFIFNTMFILGGVTVTLLSLWLQNWRYLLFIIYTPAVFIFLYMWMLTESFRWFFSKGRYEEGLKVLSKAEKMNNVVVPKEHYEQVEKQAIKQRDARKCESKASNQSSFRQILTSSMIWKRVFTVSFLWTCSTLVYYGLSINAIELSGNSYLNYIVVIVIEAPANVCKLILLDRFGRKKVIAIAFFLTALILINYGFIPAGTWSLVFYLGGKFFITLAYNSLYVFAAEVFPTNYRTTLLALCSTIGRVGSAVAPMTPLLARVYEYLPTMVFGIMAAMSGVLVLTLPETNNQKLPDSLKEAQDQDKKVEVQEAKEDHAIPETNKTRL